MKKGTTLSALSAPWKYDLPDCQKWLTVKFESVGVGTLPPGVYSPTQSMCDDTFDSYFWFAVGNVSRSFYGGGFYRPLKCGIYSFSELIADFYNPAWVHPDTILYPVSPNSFHDISGNLTGLMVRAEFLNHNDWSSDDVIGSFTEYIYPPTLQSDGRWGECIHTVTTGTQITDVGTSNISFTYAFYPNKCVDIPPELKDLYRHP